MNSDKPRKTGFFGWAVFGYANTDPLHTTKCGHMDIKMSNEQKLIDLTFQLVLTITSEPHIDTFKNKSNEEKAEWVADQLRKCGFDTYPCGMSWGKLRS